MNIIVLYADHDREDRELMDEFFSQYPDIELVRFPNGQLLLDYINAVEGEFPCFLLLDADMPEKSGIDTLKELRGLVKTSNTKAILFTQQINEEEQETAKSLKADLIVKPQTAAFVSLVGTQIIEYCYKYLAD